MNTPVTYYAWSTKNKKKRYTEITYLLSLKMKIRLGNLKANFNHDARAGRSSWQVSMWKFTYPNTRKSSLWTLHVLNWSDNQMSQLFSLQRCAFACRGFGDSPICQHTNLHDEFCDFTHCNLIKHLFYHTDTQMHLSKNKQIASERRCKTNPNTF